MSVDVHKTGAPLARYRVPDGYGPTWLYRAGSTWVSSVFPSGTITIAKRDRVVLAAKASLSLTTRPRVVLE